MPPSNQTSVDGFKTIKLPGFEICKCLGIGGMGAVYLAKQKSLGRYVAVKMIKSEFARLPRYHDRIVTEARTMAALNHPNVISCYDIITTEDHVFLIMEYIPGGLNVKDLIFRFGKLDVNIVIRILTDVVEGLSYIHQKGYIHQDLQQLGSAGYMYDRYDFQPKGSGRMLELTFSTPERDFASGDAILLDITYRLLQKDEIPSLD